MAVLAERGFDVRGVEVSPVIAAYAQEELGFGDRVFVGVLQDAPLPAASFDLICMWDVVEHVPDPVALLRRAHELLAPGGRLIIETQDIDSRFARLLGQRWHHFKHAEHIYHFNPASLRRLLGEAGFGVERLTHRYGGKYVSTGFIAERAGRLHPAISRALTPLARATADTDLYLNFMDEMIVVAQAG
jgi:SAM-dependent methyltransferase